jgi:DTW domain-containing protein
LNKRCARSPLRSKLLTLAATVHNTPQQMAQPKLPRPMCARCLRAQRTCICQWITPVEHQVEVLILQHPMEVHEAKGSARLLHLSLPRSRMVTGEVFDEAVLRACLTEPFPGDAHPTTAAPAQCDTRLRHAVLLYPTPSGALNSVHPELVERLAKDRANSARTEPVDVNVDVNPLRDSAPLRLVVLDGTWRKSRKMLHLNPLLQHLPRLALHNPPAPRYLIRKAQQSHQLSTLEATCAALVQLEGNAAAVAPLLTAFDGFVAQQLAWK